MKNKCDPLFSSYEICSYETVCVARFPSFAKKRNCFSFIIKEFIENPARHLRWIFLKKLRIIFAKSSILDVCQGSECASDNDNTKTQIRQNTISKIQFSSCRKNYAGCQKLCNGNQQGFLADYHRNRFVLVKEIDFSGKKF